MYKAKNNARGGVTRPRPFQIYTDFGTRVKELMDQEGINQKELAGYLGVKPSALGNYIRGERRPPNQVLMGLASHFHVTVDFLLGVRDIHASSADESELLQMYRILAVEQQELLLQQAKFWIGRRVM